VLAGNSVSIPHMPHNSKGVELQCPLEPVPATWFQKGSSLGSASRTTRRCRPSGVGIGNSQPGPPCRVSPGITRGVTKSSTGCYHFSMVTKRSVSLVDEVATAVEEAAKQDGVSFSAWLSNAAEKQLQVRQGLRGVAAWEGETGSLSAEEVAAGEALLARLRSGVSGVASRVRRR
jgi:hypothetical protein